MMAAIVQGVQDLYSEAQGAITWTTVLIYGSILTLTWVIYKLAILPYLSPIRKVSPLVVL